MKATSKEAYYKPENERTRATHTASINTLLKCNSDYELTCREIAGHTLIPYASVARRMSEIVRAGNAKIVGTKKENDQRVSKYQYCEEEPKSKERTFTLSEIEGALSESEVIKYIDKTYLDKSVADIVLLIDMVKDYQGSIKSKLGIK
jgi:hypothetical protein